MTTLAQFKAALDELQAACFNCTSDISEKRARVDALVAEVVADAERYRWLRDVAMGQPASAEFWPAVRLDLSRQRDAEWTTAAEYADSLDEAIDAARATSKEQT